LSRTRRFGDMKFSICYAMLLKGWIMETMEANPYTDKGKTYPIMPIPPIQANCLPIDGGPVQFVLESRALNADVITEHTAQFGAAEGHENLMADGGASLHVFGTEDGLEHLRFDCSGGTVESGHFNR
jgi:hypothetical protein